MGDRQLQQINVRNVNAKFAELDIPVVPGPSHIVPVLVGDATLTKLASDNLITNHNIYVQAINYPTVARGEERLRFTVTPGHTHEQMDHLASAVDQVFTELNIKRVRDWKAEGGRAGVGMPNATPVEPIWNDKQLGLLDGTAPKTLRDGQKGFISKSAVEVTRTKFVDLLGPLEGAVPKRLATGGKSLGYHVETIEQPALLAPVAAAA